MKAVPCSSMVEPRILLWGGDGANGCADTSLGHAQRSGSVFWSTAPPGLLADALRATELVGRVRQLKVRGHEDQAIELVLDELAMPEKVARS